MTRILKTADQRIEGKYSVDANGCHVWHGYRNTAGYGELRLNRKLVKAHRFRYAHVYGPIPPWLICCHRCNNPACVNPEHIYLGSSQDNSNDQKAAGTHLIKSRGEKHHRTTLSEGQVKAIRRLKEAGMSGKGIARIYKTSAATVSNIVNRKTWSHI